MYVQTEYNHDFALKTPLNNPEYNILMLLQWMFCSCFNWVLDHKEWKRIANQLLAYNIPNTNRLATTENSFFELKNM